MESWLYSLLLVCTQKPFQMESPLHWYFEDYSWYSWYASLYITSRTQQPIGCKWRIDWFYVNYNQSTAGSSEEIAMVRSYHEIPYFLQFCTEDLRKIVPPKILLKNLGLNFAVKELQNNVNESISESLGVSKMSVEQLVNIVKAFLNDIHERAESGEEILVSEWVKKEFRLDYRVVNCDFHHYAR